MGWKSLVDELRARRTGRKGLESDLPRSARDIVGPTGWAWSPAWDQLEEHQSTYVRSFDPKVPPSLFLSEKDRRGYNIPIPLIERMIESHSTDAED